jgi:hypothetical protein
LNRRLAFLLAAVESLVIVAIGVGILLAPMMLIWLIENDPSIDWTAPYKTSVDIWLLAHGTRLIVPAGEIVGIDTPQFIISLMPLGLSIFIAYLAFRFGRRLAASERVSASWFGAVSLYAAASFGLSTSVFDAAIYPVAWQATFFPPVFFGFFMLLGSLTAKDSTAREIAILKKWFEIKFQNLHWALRALAQPALRGGTAVVAMLFASSAALLALMLAVNWINIIRLYEGLHVSVIGGFFVTIGQLILLPNLIAFGASWLTGAGFAIGLGSQISPLGTATGPIPSIPVLAALPVGQLGFGMIAVVVPLVAAFIATLAIRRHADEIRFEFANPLNAAFSLGFSIASVAAIEMGIVALVTSGAIGPGRLAFVGITPWLVMLVTFIEVAAVSILVSFYSAKPQAADHPLLLNPVRPKRQKANMPARPMRPGQAPSDGSLN